jgi:hypothetical protein
MMTMLNRAPTARLGPVFQVGTDVGTEFAAWSMMYDAG